MMNNSELREPGIASIKDYCMNQTDRRLKHGNLLSKVQHLLLAAG